MDELKHSPALLGSYFRFLRSTAGVRSELLTLEKAAKRIGISSVVLGNIESGKTQHPSFDTILLLCRLYGIAPCNVTKMDPNLSNRQSRAIEQFSTVLTDEQRNRIAGSIEMEVADRCEAGFFRSPIIEGDKDVLFSSKKHEH